MTNTCPACNAPVDVNAKFCRNCGTSVVWTKHCQNCDSLIEAGQRFCPNCGQAVGSVVTRSGDVAVRIDAETKVDEKICAEPLPPPGFSDRDQEKKTMGFASSNNKKTLIAGLSVTAGVFVLSFIIYMASRLFPNDVYVNDVYVAGNETNAQGEAIATVWKNEKVYWRFTDGNYSRASSIFVSDDAVYVAGDRLNYVGNPIAALWKNGALQDDSIFLRHDEHGIIQGIFANSIYVSGDDVYVAGMALDFGTGPVAMLIKNFEIRPAGGGNDLSNAISVYVLNNDVYLAGVSGSIDKSFATIWKNTVPQRLSNKASFASSVYAVNEDVYVAGYEDNEQGNSVATLWKNGVAQRLSNNRSGANSVVVANNDVYVVGYERNAESKSVAVIWKNGVVAQRLSDGQEDSDAQSVCVVGKDVFVAGTVNALGTPSVATLWKNGAPHNISDGSSDAIAKSVFVRRSSRPAS